MSWWIDGTRKHIAVPPCCNSIIHYIAPGLIVIAWITTIIFVQSTFGIPDEEKWKRNSGKADSHESSEYVFGSRLRLKKLHTGKDDICACMEVLSRAYIPTLRPLRAVFPGMKRSSYQSSNGHLKNRWVSGNIGLYTRKIVN